MTRRPLWLVPAALGVLAAALPAAAQAPATQAPPPRDPGRGGSTLPAPSARAPAPPPASELLQQAYDQISLLSLCVRNDALKLPREDAALLDQVKDLYRAADKARRGGDERRAGAYAMAALDAAGGLMQEIGVSMPAVEGLPAPPTPADAGRDAAAPARTGDAPRDGRDAPRDTGRAAPAADREPATPEASARQFIRQVRDRLDDQARADVPREARPFVDAGRRAGERAQRALQDRDYRKAFGFAYAAAAWSQVGDTLRQADAPARPRGADDRGAGLPPPRPRPDDRRDSAPPPPRRP